MICFESAFSEIARANVRDGADVLVVTTNNRSYRRSANSEQHVAMSQMRAAETGRPLVHSSISGSTAVIDEQGRVLSRTALFQNGVTIADVTGRTGRTLFVRFGDWVVYSSFVVVAVAVCRRRGGCAAREVRPARPTLDRKHMSTRGGEGSEREDRERGGGLGGEHMSTPEAGGARAALGAGST